MVPKILCVLPICLKPTNLKSQEDTKTRTEQYRNGLNKFFEFNINTFNKYNIDIVIFDNTINNIIDISDNIIDIIPKNVKILFNIVNNYGCHNKGAGLIETWLYNKELISQYDWFIHFEPRQLLKSNQFIESFLEKPRNLFTININVKHFNTGLFCIQTKTLINYINNVNLNNMSSNSISIENDLYLYFINNNISFDTLNKMDLIWFPMNHIPLHY